MRNVKLVLYIVGDGDEAPLVWASVNRLYELGLSVDGPPFKCVDFKFCVKNRYKK